MRESLHHACDFGPCVVQNGVARRITPTEALRMQGFPDDWLDGVFVTEKVRYQMIGNSWAVPVAAWILARLVKVDRRLHRRPPTFRDDRRQFDLLEAA